ncbi:unnamed protein product [Closterium sp. Naga37s-1]|nr:unnamed protein product [Closterium sp. Naga37s-1]
MMAFASSLFLKLALISLVLHAVDAANMPAGGCHTCYVCPYIDDLATATITQSTYNSYNFIGDYQGLFNNQGGQFTPHQRGPGLVNFERYTEVGTIFDVVKGVYGNTLQVCCRASARSTYCYEWHWFKNLRLAGENANVAGFIDHVQCYLLEKNGGSGTSDFFKTPYAGNATTQAANLASYPLSFVGGLYNRTALVENDLHLMGAHSTHYDFTGRLDKSFCLFFDRRFHEHGEDGFLLLLEIDGTMTAPPSVGESIATESGLVVTKVTEAKEGPFDVDQFQVRVAGLAELDVRVHVAHPLLQTLTEAETHFNVELSDVKAEGKGFLDGDVEDYIRSSIVAPDCKYATYGSV